MKYPVIDREVHLKLFYGLGRLEVVDMAQGELFEHWPEEMI